MHGGVRRLNGDGDGLTLPWCRCFVLLVVWSLGDEDCQSGWCGCLVLGVFLAPGGSG